MGFAGWKGKSCWQPCSSPVLARPAAAPLRQPACAGSGPAVHAATSLSAPLAPPPVCSLVVIVGLAVPTLLSKTVAAPVTLVAAAKSAYAAARQGSASGAVAPAPGQPDAPPDADFLPKGTAALGAAGLAGLAAEPSSAELEVIAEKREDDVPYTL